MTNFKEELITEYIKLQREKVAFEEAEAEDVELKNVKSTMKKVASKLSALERPYRDKALSITQASEEIQELLKNRWDIEDKTYECEVGSATLRTTKSLEITDKKQLITILLNIDKLPEAIRSWNLGYLRKLKDVNLIEDAIAYYDEHQNVVIKGDNINV